MEDTWFAGQWFPVGSLILCEWNAGGGRVGVRWLTPSELVGASRHDERLKRREHGVVARWKLRRRQASADSGSVVAEAEAILRNQGQER